MNMFEQASRIRLRFSSPKGNLTSEDLWHLPLTQLDAMAKDLHKALKNRDPVSFIGEVAESTQEEEVLQLMFNIVKHVIEVLLDRKAERELAAQNRARRQHIMGLIQQKKDKELESLSVEDLEKLL